MQSMAAVSSLRRLPRSRPLLSSFARASTATGDGDPRIHSEDPQDDDAVETANSNYAEQLQQQQAPESARPKPPTTDRIPPFGSSPRLERSELTPPANSSFQQRRRWSSTTRPPPLDDVTCDAGWDGGVDWGAQQEEENRAYFAGRKATPLSEVEFADTRKPIGRAWDEGAAGEDVVGMMVEDSVDAALERAEKMFLDAKVRGDPNTPWGQVVWKKKSGGC